MLEKIKQVIAEQLDVNEDEITEDTNLQDDLGADSLDIVELIRVRHENEWRAREAISRG